MRWIVRGGIALLALVAIVAIALAAYGWVSRPPTADRAALIAKADAYDVRRDEWGVPHIKGATDADAAFGLAYAHSEDDFATIQDVALATRGQLAGSNGPKAAPTDYVVSLLDVWPTVNAGYPKLPADVRRVLEAYADGVNAYGAAHPRALKPGLLPLTGRDVAAGFVFKTPFFYGLDTVLRDLNAPPAKDGKPEKEPLKGSNGLAVGPSRNADGATRLLVNSHQPYTGPVAWYEAVVESGEGWHVAGGFFPGAPFMLHGHNAHLGWANTVSKPDLVDVYRLTLNPQNKNQYRLDGAWRDFERSTATLRIKLWGPFYLPVRKAVLRSAHGPVMVTKTGAFALRYAGMGEYRQPEQYYRLDKANNLAEWRAAMALQALPSINYVYADQAGNIGFVHNGQYPNRVAAADWSKTLPGDRSDLIWKGYRPYDQTPQIWNPKSGYVFNSNNTPFQATDPADDLRPGDFPASMGLQTNMTNRAVRVLETVGRDPAITDESFRRYKYDLTYSMASPVGALMRSVLAVDAKGDADTLRAQAILKAWDGRNDVHDRGAALANLIIQPVLFATDVEGQAPPTPAAALAAAIKTLKTHFGRLDPEWGQVNRIRRGPLDLAIDGGSGTYRSVWGRLGTDGTLTAEGGDTLILFVTWDKAGQLRSDSIHQFGSATLDAGSPHYADQTPLFVAMKTKPVLFTEDQLKGHVREDYRPGRR
ncbi:MAG: Glutaryl-7-aminocephalosporanic-acid acylase [Caulobacter sp.]|nr:Glutaryl-7-aminocephalosporanic-acid acylase [Caulobacter sp.]